MTLSVIATLPPYAKHRTELIAHSRISALRFNTVQPAAEAPKALLTRLMHEVGDKPLWLDLKARQLRITEFAYLPYAYVTLNHNISVDLPTTVHFKDGTMQIVGIKDGNKLILDGPPGRIVGDGEPVNILDDSLVVQGCLTEQDVAYVRAAKELGLHRFMVSFTESEADLKEVLALDPDAELIAKIESANGLVWAENLILDPDVPLPARLMAARDDLFIHLERDPQRTLAALENIRGIDPDAVVASRLLTSLEEGVQVSLQDISDFELMRRLGYTSFMLSDGLCLKSDAARAVLKLLEQLIPESEGDDV